MDRVLYTPKQWLKVADRATAAALMADLTSRYRCRGNWAATAARAPIPSSFSPSATQPTRGRRTSPGQTC